VIYDNEKNPSRVFKIYERLFKLKQGDRYVIEFYGELKGHIDELKMHQPVVTDAATLRRYRQDLAISKFLFGLSPTLRSQTRGQILGGDSIPALTVTFSRVMRVSTKSEVLSAPSIEQCAMISSLTEVVATILENEDVNSLEVDVDLMEADKVPLKKVPDNVGIVNIAITSSKSVGRNLDAQSGHSYLILILQPVWYSSEFFICYSWLFLSCTVT